MAVLLENGTKMIHAFGKRGVIEIFYSTPWKKEPDIKFVCIKRCHDGCRVTISAAVLCGFLRIKLFLLQAKSKSGQATKASGLDDFAITKANEGNPFTVVLEE